MISKNKLKIINEIKYRAINNRLIEMGANTLKECGVSEAYVLRPLFFLYLNKNLTKEEFIFRLELMDYKLKDCFPNFSNKEIRSLTICKKVNTKLPKGYKYERNRDVRYWLSIGYSIGAIAAFYKGFLPYAEANDSYYNISFNLNEKDFK